MAVPGRLALVKVSGALVAFTDEAFTSAGDSLTYQITSTTKRVWDRTATITVKDGGVAVDPVADPYVINRLTGQVIFTNTGTRTITATGSYLPLSTAAEAKSYTYSIMAPNLDNTAFGATWATRTQALKDVTGTIGRWVSVDTYFSDAMLASVPVVIEFWSASGGTYDTRVWATLDKVGVQSVINGLVEETVDFSGVPDVDARVISG